jgi:hypothetical protein
MDERRNWEGLERKLSEGLSIRRAALSVGIPVAEACTWLMELRAIVEYEPHADALTADGAREDGLMALRELAGSCEDPEVRVKAAIRLMNHYRDERARLEGKRGDKGPDMTGQRELFGPWDLTLPGV